MSVYSVKSNKKGRLDLTILYESLKLVYGSKRYILRYGWFC